MMEYSNTAGRLAVLMATALFISACGGCQFDATQEGEQGNLEFAYSPADGDTTFDRPIAVDSGLKMYVEPLANRSFDQITDVTVSDNSILRAEIDGNSSDTLNLEARSSGEVRLEVRAQGGGETYGDWTTIRTGDVDRVRMAHECTSAADAAYLIDREASVELERQNRAGEQLIGSAQSHMDALRSCHVDLYPDEYQERPYCDEAGLHFSTLPEFGAIDIFPADGIGTAGSSHQDMGMHVIDPDLMQFHQPDTDLRVDRNRTIELEAYRNPPDSSGVWPVCTDMDLRIEIYSGNICTGSAGETTLHVDASDENEVQLRGQRSGYCDFDIYLDDEPGIDPWPMEVYVERD